MKKRYTLSIISILIITIMLCTFLVLPVSAISETKATALAKIESTLHEKMETALPNEKIPVAIWYVDIDQTQVDSLTKEKVGFSQDDIALTYEMPLAELMGNLEKDILEAVDEMQAYLNRTEVKREKERRRADEYITVRREYSREKYNEKSNGIIRDLAIDEEFIAFKSQYAPFVIASITSEDILMLANDKRIAELGYYEEPEVAECTSITIKEATGHKKLVDKLALTGEGVKIGLFEMGGFPETDQTHTNASNLVLGTEVNLDLSVYCGTTKVGCSEEDKSSTELAYFDLPSNAIGYEIRIDKITETYTENVRYGYAYSNENAYMTPITNEGIYYIKNYNTNSYLTLDSTTGDTSLTNFTGADTQLWIVRETGSNKYELCPAYGSVSGKINTGDSYNTYSYYANLGENNMNLTLAKDNDLSSLKDRTVAFYTTINNTSYFLSASGTDTLFCYSSLNSVATNRMWCLEKVNYRRGDANLDGSLSVSDASLISEYVAKMVTFNNKQLFFADANYDGVVNVKDVTRVQNILTGNLIY